MKSEVAFFLEMLLIHASWEKWGRNLNISIQYYLIDLDNRIIESRNWFDFSELNFQKDRLEITIRNLKSEVTLLEEVWSMRLGRIGKMRSKFKHLYAIYIWILWYKIIRSRNSFHVLQLNFVKRKTIKNARRRMKRDVIVLLIFLDSLMGDSEEPESIDSVIFKNP